MRALFLAVFFLSCLCANVRAQSSPAAPAYTRSPVRVHAIAPQTRRRMLGYGTLGLVSGIALGTVAGAVAGALTSEECDDCLSFRSAYVGVGVGVGVALVAAPLLTSLGIVRPGERAGHRGDLAPVWGVVMATLLAGSIAELAIFSADMRVASTATLGASALASTLVGMVGLGYLTYRRRDRVRVLAGRISLSPVASRQQVGLAAGLRF